MTLLDDEDMQADEAGSGVRSTVVPDEGSGDTADRTIDYPGKRSTVRPDKGSGDGPGHHRLPR